jgi:hypothetical protein
MDDRIKKIVENELIKKPGPGFTDKVMNEIFELKVPVKVKPLISKGVWYVIGSIMLLFTVLIFISNPQSTGKYDITWMQNIESFFTNLHFPSIDIASSINFYVVIGACLALLLLTVFDHFLFRRNKI